MIGQILSTLWIQMDRRLQPFAHEKLSQRSPESKDVVQMLLKCIDGVGWRVSWEGVCPGAKHQATWKHSERCQFFKSLRCMKCTSRTLFVLSSYPSRSDVPVLDEEAWNFNTKTTAQAMQKAKSQI